MTMHKSANTQWLDQAASMSLNLYFTTSKKNRKKRKKPNEQIVVGGCENILVKIFIFMTRVHLENVGRFFRVIRSRDSTGAKKKIRKNLDMTK